MKTRVSRDLLAGSVALLVYVLVFAGYSDGCGSSHKGTVVHAMSGLMEEYQKRHDGVLPTNWSELQQVMNRPIDEWLSPAVPAQRYAFVSPPLPLSGPVQGKLLMLNRSAIWDTTRDREGVRGPGRYFLFQDEEGRLAYHWMEELKVKALFAAAAVALPVPDAVPERAEVTRARWMMYLMRGLYALDLLVMLYVLGRLTWKVLRWEVPWAYDV